MDKKQTEELTPAAPAENGHAAPPAVNRAARRRQQAREKKGQPVSETNWVPLRKRFLDKLSSFLMTSPEVKNLLESVVEASGEDLAFVGDIGFIEFEIQAARVKIRLARPEEIAAAREQQARRA